MSSSTPSITLNWPFDPQLAQGYDVYRRMKGGTTWTQLDSGLPADTTSYVDATVSTGLAYDYRVVRSNSSGAATATGNGYITAGIDMPLTDPGTVILMIDQNFSTALAPEIAQLRQDLIGEGWNVVKEFVPRSDTVETVKSVIVSDHTTYSDVRQVLLIGEIAIPMSGPISPDGHPYRNFPADAFYGDMDGTWTGADGVYSQTNLDGSLAPELAVGRIDMRSMTDSTGSEVDLLRQYLDRDHEFRTMGFPAVQQGRTGAEWICGRRRVQFYFCRQPAELPHACRRGQCPFRFLV